MSYLRWNLLLGEWVIVAPKRSKRPFQDDSRPCPFCPAQLTEAPEGWVVFTKDNDFPALTPEAGLVPIQEGFVMEAPGYGSCKVIILTPDHNAQVEKLSDEHLESVFQEFVRLYKEMGSKEGIEYVLVFENRGRASGASQQHPHAQAIAMPIIPPRIKKEMEQFRKTWENEEECLLCQLVENELKSRDRIINESDHFISLVPFGARLSYEAHIYPKAHVGSLEEISDYLRELGAMVRDTVKRYSKVFDENAYIMALHTAPVRGEHPYWHFHIEFYPPWRDRKRLKYLAGGERGAWIYTNETLPEDAARELREAL